MNTRQIEKFYAQFYPKWKSDAYWELIKKLNVSPKQKISTMSCGQRSQVALGLILAQDPDLLILDDFSMGLDPGYRRLFIDYLREYAKAENKTVFTTSHIIQDMERLIDDVLILDFNKVLVHSSVDAFMSSFNRFDFDVETAGAELKKDSIAVNIEKVKNHVEFYTFSTENQVLQHLKDKKIEVKSFHKMEMKLEDAFIGLTGKY
jgi:ABC-2 type transport system ATP-binding protein